MKSLWWCTLAASIALAQTNQSVDAGRALYQARCATCHAVDLGGGDFTGKITHGNCSMSILVDSNTRVVTHGITGKAGAL